MENGLTMKSTRIPGQDAKDDKSEDPASTLQSKLGYGPQSEAPVEEGPLGQGGQPAVPPPEEPDRNQPRPAGPDSREDQRKQVDLNDEGQVRALCAELYVAPIEIARAVAAVGNNCSAVRMYLRNRPR